jgi:hypothetical protein
MCVSVSYVCNPHTSIPFLCGGYSVCVCSRFVPTATSHAHIELYVTASEPTLVFSSAEVNALDLQTHGFKGGHSLARLAQLLEEEEEEEQRESDEPFGSDISRIDPSSSSFAAPKREREREHEHLPPLPHAIFYVELKRALCQSGDYNQLKEALRRQHEEENPGCVCSVCVVVCERKYVYVHRHLHDSYCFSCPHTHPRLLQEELGLTKEAAKARRAHMLVRSIYRHFVHSLCIYI